MNVLAIDPGEKVGWATADLFTTMDGLRMAIPKHGIANMRDFAEQLDKSFGDYDVVIYETYRLRSDCKKYVGDSLLTSQLIGMIRFLGWKHPHVRIVSQEPGVKNTGWKVAKTRLPQVQEILDRLPKSHDDAHDGDALAHLTYFYFHEAYDE